MTAQARLSLHWSHMPSVPNFHVLTVMCCHCLRNEIFNHFSGIFRFVNIFSQSGKIVIFAYSMADNHYKLIHN